MTYWTAVHTHACEEDKAAYHLRRQGYTIYLPRFLKRRRHARRTEVVSAPFFPRYLFVAIDEAATAWRAIRSTCGVSNIVCFGDRPARVPSAVVEEIQAREDERGFVVAGAGRTFSKGEKVRIAEGPFRDLDGLFTGVADEQRILLLLNLMGRQVKVRVSLEAIGPAI